MSLGSLPFFTDIDSETLALLQPLFEKFTCPVGTTVIAQGAQADFLYLVEKGKVDITFKPYDSESITVTHVGAGGLFGWSALIGGPKYTSSGVAIEDLTAMRIHGRDLRKLCVEHSEAGRIILDRLAGAVSKRWTNAHEQVKAILENGLHY